MSFKTDMQAMAQDLIDVVFGSEGEVSKFVTVMRTTLQSIDEETDTLISSEESQLLQGILGPWDKDGSAAIYSQTSTTTSGQIKINDLSLKVAYLDLEWIPTADKDTVMDELGNIFLIISTKVDAADAVMTMQLRRIKGVSI